jgi:hypothetical protein
MVKLYDRSFLQVLHFALRYRLQRLVKGKKR